MLNNKTIILFISLTVFLTACRATITQAAKTVKINGQEIKVEIADTPESQYRGLSFKESLCADCGMLFKFSEKSEKTFVMRNMKFGIDIIFIDGDLPAGKAGKIIKIYKDLKPEGENPKNFYNSNAPADYVLEVNAGYADSHNIKIGDKIELSL